MKLVVAAVAVLATGAVAQPLPRLEEVVVERAGPNVVIRGWWRSTGNPDSAITTLQSAGFTSQRHQLPGTATQDSFTVLRPAAGVTLTGAFCVQTTKRGWVIPAPVCRAWAYTEPSVLPPPVVDSVKTDTLLVALRIVPLDRPIALQAPVDTVFCAVVEFANGSKGYRGPRAPSCSAVADVAIPISADGQAWVDRQCFSFQTVVQDAQGRTLTLTQPEPCSGVATVAAR